MARKSKTSTPSTPRTRVRRISEKYRPHLGAIAQIYVECAGNAAATERAVRERIAACGSFKAEFLKGWLTHAEFASCVKESEQSREAQIKLRPEVRGIERIKWLLTIEPKLKERWEASEEGKAKDDALKAWVSVGQEIRQEESHMEAMRQKAALRDFVRFVRNMVAYIKTKHPGAYSTLFPILRDVMGQIERIASGKFEEGS